MSIKIKELPELERPYEKLENYGEKSLSNAELLAIIIKTGTKEETAIEISQRLLKLNDTTDGDLTYLQKLTIEELMQVKGIGKVKAIQLKAVGELAVRMFKKEKIIKTVIHSPDEAAKLLMSDMKNEKQEIFQVIMLNEKNEVLKIKKTAIGNAEFTQAQTRDVLSEPLKIGATKVIVAHNHPTGDSTPSPQDRIYTEYLYYSAELLGIELMDHLVIGNMEYTSILLEKVTNEEEKIENEKKEGK
ncbi:MAG: DNA repair protein RadC [Clostridia bacterium]|nr:DNA repair protein RadC [Clostridia bacterium]